MAKAGPNPSEALPALPVLLLGEGPSKTTGTPLNPASRSMRCSNSRPTLATLSPRSRAEAGDVPTLLP